MDLYPNPGQHGVLLVALDCYPFSVTDINKALEHCIIAVYFLNFLRMWSCQERSQCDLIV